MTSKLDSVYRRMIISKFFSKGWGDPDHLMKIFTIRKQISNRSTCFELIPDDHPIIITREETKNGYKVFEGKFLSPLALHLPEVIPDEAKQACFQMVLPMQWRGHHKPICIHLAGTGDHNYWRRRNIMAKPLLKYDIGSIILENPFYGYRKPRDQIRSSLHNVSDLFVMGACLILECSALLNWCEKNGFGPLGLSGVSMGGHMASLAATSWPKPVVLVPCLSWTTASIVFIQGVLSQSIDWNLLQKQYLEDSYYEKLANSVKIIDDGFLSQAERASKTLLYNAMTKYWHSSRLLFPCDPNISPRYYYTRSTRKPKDAVYFMCAIMDECTHLKNFAVPFDTSLITAVCAQLDGYVPRRGCASMEDIWPGAKIYYLKTGHIGAFIRYNKVFRKCIVDTFELAKKQM